MTDRDPCALCGREEREKFTPAAFSMLKECGKCERRHCTDCRGDYDASYDDGEWSDHATCKECAR